MPACNCSILYQSLLLKCSRGCAGGVRYREVYCASLLDGSPVDPNRCIELYGPDGMPPAYDICYNRCKTLCSCMYV